MHSVGFSPDMSKKREGFWFALSAGERDEWRALAIERGVTLTQLIREAVREKRKELCLRCNTEGVLVWCRNDRFTMRVCAHCQGELGAIRVSA